MLCLGELAVANPDVGSYQTYATKFISPGAGYVVGWMSWLNWSVTIGLELLTVSILMKRWFPDVSPWIWCIVFAILLFSINALSTKSFAEVGEPAPFLSNYTDHGGLFPHGIAAILITMIGVNFSFQGTELVGIAAGESENPEKTIPKAINSTAWRILIFFILSVFVLAGLFPWKEAGLVESPFVVVFDNIGIPYAADIMNFVIITAVLSVANSGLYATSRMLWSMSRQGMIHERFGKLNKSGVPINALAASMIVGCLCLLCGFFAEDTVYLWLLSIAGFGAVFVWASIALSNYLGRKKFLRNGGKISDLKFRTPFYPIVPLAALSANVLVMVSLAFIPDQRMALYCGIPFLIGCALYYRFAAKDKMEKKRLVQEQDLMELDRKKIL
jgi:arginine/ornithine permease